jgi:hypothetical protein
MKRLLHRLLRWYWQVVLNNARRSQRRYIRYEADAWARCDHEESEGYGFLITNTRETIRRARRELARLA